MAATVAGLAHDGELAGAIQVALRGEAGTQGMAGVGAGSRPAASAARLTISPTESLCKRMGPSRPWRSTPSQ